MKMQKLFLLTLTITGILFGLIVSLNHAFADPESNSTNISMKEGGPTYLELKTNLHNFIQAKNMNRQSEKLILDNVIKNQQFSRQYWKDNPFPSNETMQVMIAQKYQFAKNLTKSDVEKRSWYDKLVNQQKLSMLEKLSKYIEAGKNNLPTFVSCKALHRCPIILENMTSTNSTNITIAINETVTVMDNTNSSSTK